MKIKNIRDAKKGLSYILAVNLYMMKMFFWEFLPEKEFDLVINSSNDIMQVEDLPFLVEEEYQLAFEEDYERENGNGRKLKRKNTMNNSQYCRNARNSLGKPDYFCNSKDF